LAYVLVGEPDPAVAHVDGARAEEQARARALEPLAHDAREPLARDREVTDVEL